MPCPRPRILPLSLLALSLPLSLRAAGSDTDTTTPPEIDLLSPSALFGSDSSNFTTADLDGDGDRDLVHLPNGSTDQGGDPHAYWIENLGDRSFAALRLIHLAPTGPGQRLEQAVIWNLLGDSKPEIFVSRRQYSNQDYHLALALSPKLQDDGTPAPVDTRSLGGSSVRPWELVDFDGSGEAYIIKFSAVPGNHTLVSAYKYGTGGLYTYREAYSVRSSYYDPDLVVDVDACDVDGDGDIDLCLACSDDKMRIIERKQGLLLFLEPRLVPIEDPWSQWVDVNGDGRRDILQFDGSWYENLGNWDFAKREASPAYALFENLVSKKVTPRAGQSALVEAIVLNTVLGGIYELITIPFDSAEPLSRGFLPGSVNDSTIFLHHGDVDGDGQKDVVYSYSESGSIYGGSRSIAIAWGSPSGFLVTQPVHEGPSIAHQVFSADFNQDQCPDLVAGPDARGDYHVHYSRGAAGPAEGVLLNDLKVPNATLRILGAATIDKDKCPDLVCRYTPQPFDPDHPQSAIVVVRGRKDGSFIPPVIPGNGLIYTPGTVVERTSGYWNNNSDHLIDWDRDGDLDLISAGLWFENVNGSFPPGQRALVSLGNTKDFLGNPTIIGATIVGDIDGDRAPDIISLVHGTGVGNEPPKTMLVAFNDGRGGIGETLELPIPLAAIDVLGNPVMAGTAALADLNADKGLDLWIREVAGTDSLGHPTTTDLWLRNPGRRTARAMSDWVSTPLASDTVPPGIAFGDFDGDRKAANLKKGSGEWLSPYGYLLPTRSGPLLSAPYDFTNGYIDLTGVGFQAGVDIDGDRDTDFLLGGGASPLIILRNPSADDSKRRPLKAKPVKWLGELPVVR